MAAAARAAFASSVATIAAAANQMAKWTVLD
jgi:hypothetical protein